jgi:hypothetical protein
VREPPARKSGRSYRREHWDGQKRLEALRELAANAPTKKEREHFQREAEMLVAASGWKCAYCGTTIQELINEGAELPYNLTAFYCPGGDCYRDAKHERMREQYQAKKAAAKKADKEQKDDDNE